MRRLLARIGLWCLRRSQVNQLEARLGDSPAAAKTVAAALYVFETTPATPMLLGQMVKAYCQMHGVRVEVGTVEPVEEPQVPRPSPPPGGLVH